MLLPAHWQTAAVLFGVWWIGAEVVLAAKGKDVRHRGCAPPTGSTEADAAVGAGEVAVLSLDPFGKPAADLPFGITDYATSVRVHGDQISPERLPGPRWTAGRSTEVFVERPSIGRRTGFHGTAIVCCRRPAGKPLTT